MPHSTPAVNDVEVGESLPPQTPHAVSVSLPTWRANVGYEEGEEWVVSKMVTGYPRFFVHKIIQRFAAKVAAKYGQPDDQAMLFPTSAIAGRCRDFFLRQAPELDAQQLQVIDLVPTSEKARSEEFSVISPRVSAVLFPGFHFKVAKTFWQHSGEGVSSRRAEYCESLYDEGLLVDSKETEDVPKVCKGPRRYRQKTSIDLTGSNGHSIGSEKNDSIQFVEQRFGRNLDISQTKNAKLAVRRRIAGSLTADVGLDKALSVEKDADRTRDVPDFSEDDVYLYPCGMSSIFNAHRIMMSTRTPLKSIVYGFPYIDTLKIVEKFGPGCHFCGFGSSEELDDLERRLEGGERFLALFTEFLGNPLLRSPDLERIRYLADKYDFYVVVDETIGNFLNVNVLPLADIVVSSLTKVFSGDSNVMGGGQSKNYKVLKRAWDADYEDNHWAEDSIFLERNSRDFVSRIERINANAGAIAEVLKPHPRVKKVYYPKYSDTRQNYERCRNPNGGYGGLLSATFHTKQDAAKFFDNLDTVKGPSLGTNFTLSSPYVILAHYHELDWAASWGVEADLVRFSVGLEETSTLVGTFQRALEAITDTTA
ncbi:Cystathionine gamma-synthase [Didymosphaeria variabile]|uniref:cystathionine gamma-synthase n=1 Tax=Didymosphaeria variabile TaxID=1932322 RepID=A0A9W9C8A9_9PLEO|nr:Cystathionine gamma-synthase [Didymosphaeria variabile]KAJ4348224.1 Cystathionine gamma-synthase [Didymosphaeria variabile]